MHGPDMMTSMVSSVMRREHPWPQDDVDGFLRSENRDPWTKHHDVDGLIRSENTASMDQP